MSNPECDICGKEHPRFQPCKQHGGPIRPRRNRGARAPYPTLVRDALQTAECGNILCSATCPKCFHKVQAERGHVVPVRAPLRAAIYEHMAVKHGI